MDGPSRGDEADRAADVVTHGAPTTAAPISGVASFPQQLLRLQAAAGNRAVGAWLSRSGLESLAVSGRGVRESRPTPRVLARQQVGPKGGSVFLKLGSPQALVIPPDDDDCARQMIASNDTPFELVGAAGSADETLSDVGATGLAGLPPVVPTSGFSIPGLGNPCLLEQPPPGSITDFEADIRDGKRRITGVILDPETEEIIGYRMSASGVYQIVDREGNLVDGGEAGVERPLVDPIDFIPTPGAIAKGVTVVGKVGIKVLGKFVVKEAVQEAAKKGAQEVSQGAFSAMKAASVAILSRSARAALRDIPVIARTITEDGLAHSFDRHAAQWFGRQVERTTHLVPWRQLIEQATRSTQILPWSSGATKTIAHLAFIEGKPFVVQFTRDTGELLTAFVPSQRQLKAMLALLAAMK